jgi:hypothetical protein
MHRHQGLDLRPGAIMRLETADTPMEVELTASVAGCTPVYEAKLDAKRSFVVYSHPHKHRHLVHIDDLL